MKVLLSAYSCEPGKGSERGVGWNVAREVARYHDVWVLTRPDESKEAIEAELARNPVPNLHFVYFTVPFWQDSMRWGQSGAMQLHYYFWQIQAYFEARQLHREIQFDLAHHVTFVKYSSPSFLSLLPIPFIWGPVGGGESAPQSFWQDFTLKAKLYEWARSFVRTVGEHDPFVQLTARKSTVVRATTEDTAQRLRRMGAENVQICPEVGLLEDEIRQLNQYLFPKPEQAFRCVSVGRLLHWKGFYLGIRAFAQAKIPHSEYWILGQGPQLDALRQLAQDLGVADQVKLPGFLPREEALAQVARSHVLLHPSLHDSGGWVCIEAMAIGRPVICLDLGGPSVQINADTGFKIPAQTPEQAVNDMAEKINLLAQDRILCQKMGDKGRQYVRANYSWKVVGEKLNALYQVSVQPQVCTEETV